MSEISCQIIDFKLYKCILFLKLQPSSIHFNIYLLSTMYIFSSLKSITYLNSKLIQPKKKPAYKIKYQIQKLLCIYFRCEILGGLLSRYVLISF